MWPRRRSFPSGTLLQPGAPATKLDKAFLAAALGASAPASLPQGEVWLASSVVSGRRFVTVLSARLQRATTLTPRDLEYDDAQAAGRVGGSAGHATSALRPRHVLDTSWSRPEHVFATSWPRPGRSTSLQAPSRLPVCRLLSTSSTVLRSQSTVPSVCSGPGPLARGHSLAPARVARGESRAERPAAASAALAPRSFRALGTPVSQGERLIPPGSFPLVPPHPGSGGPARESF